MILDELKALRASGKFHHATYRDQGTVWEGLWIYVKSETGFNGFEPAGAFFKGDQELDAAHAELKETGISLGAYGQG